MCITTISTIQDTVNGSCVLIKTSLGRHSRPICRPTVGRHVGRESVDMSVDSRSTCRPTLDRHACRPTPSDTSPQNNKTTGNNNPKPPTVDDTGRHVGRRIDRECRPREAFITHDPTKLQFYVSFYVRLSGAFFCKVNPFQMISSILSISNRTLSKVTKYHENNTANMFICSQYFLCLYGFLRDCIYHSSYH